MSWINPFRNAIPEQRPRPDKLADVTPEFMHRVCTILGEDGITEEDLEARILTIADSPMHARRLIDCTREAFGLMLIGHMGQVQLPTTFYAENAAGEWIPFSFNVEPVFPAALRAASELAHTDAGSAFKNIASASAMVDAINKALNAGEDIDGAVL